MITNLPYSKASFIALAPYLTYTFNKYHLQSIMNDQSPYFTNYKQRLYNYLQSMKIDHYFDLDVNLNKTTFPNNHNGGWVYWVLLLSITTMAVGYIGFYFFQ